MDNTSQIYDVLAGGYQTLEGRKMAPWRMHTEKKSVGIGKTAASRQSILL